MTVNQIVEALQQIKEDVPRKMQERVAEVIQCLECGDDTSTKVSKARHMLEELSDYDSIEAMTRTQLFNVASMLETL